MTTARQTLHLSPVLLLAAASLVCSQEALALAADAPESLPVFQADVDRAGTHQYTNYREPVVVRTKSGRLIVGLQAGNRLRWPERSGQDLVIRMSDESNHYKDVRFIALPWQGPGHRAGRDSSSKCIDDRIRFLPDLPNSIGVAGPFVGVHDGALIVAGGANFPNKSLIDGGQKVWHDQAYVLLPGNKTWDTKFKLKRPIAYGGSATTKDGVVIVGGSDSERDFSEAWLLQWNEDERGLAQSPLPSLPNATFECRAAAIGDRVYVVTGRSIQHPNHDLKKTWMLDLSAPAEQRGWKELSAWPGPARANTNLAVQEWNGRECLFLFAGVHVTRSDAGEVVRNFRTDGYRYDPVNDKWTAIASLPVWDDPRSIPDKARFARQPASCTAGAAIGIGNDSIYVFSGTTGRYILLPDGTMRPFADLPLNPRRVLKYDVVNNRWSHIGQMPIGAIVTSAVKWNGQVVIPSGEIKPGIRTPRVQTLTLMKGGN
jgi:N-acetylneuraminic acid mutarotase